MFYTYWSDILYRLKTIFLFPQGTAIVDFTGTGHEVFGNINTPRAVTLSALIYCLRCMVGHDVPLNQVGSFYGAFSTTIRKFQI